jgi:hypothetical protein
MTRAELLDLLAVERHAPGPREPCYVRCEPPRPLTEAEQTENRLTLARAVGDVSYLQAVS